MSHIDVHEIKLYMRYPNSRQEDITDAFMRGYQEAMKIGYDSRKVGEKATYMGMRKLARWASSLLTGIMPYVDYSRCTALEAVAAWKVEAHNLGIEAGLGAGHERD